ncbi:MAG: hypothetical protein Q7V19_17825 [Bacteroidales bacterium]|nr:hypothetical protein [Bacteroidales bacterium]
MFANITGVAAHAFTGFSLCRGGKKPQMNLRRLWWHENATLHRLREWKSILLLPDVKWQVS